MRFLDHSLDLRRHYNDVRLEAGGLSVQIHSLPTGWPEL